MEEVKSIVKRKLHFLTNTIFPEGLRSFLLELGTIPPH